MFSNTRFQQVLEALPGGFFDQANEKFDAERYDKRFKLRDHVLALVFAQLTGTRSLRELEEAFNAKAGTHYHLRVNALKKSTLADANARRNPDAFKYLVEKMMTLVKGRQKKELKEFLCLIDSTPIQLGGRGFEWTEDNAIQRTQGLKVHMAINGHETTPMYLDITAPNVNDITPAKAITLEKGMTYVFDKGYYDYNWWNEIDEAQATFVTRYKTHAALEHVADIELDPEKEHILKDERMKFKKYGRKNAYRPKEIRRIVVKRDDDSTLVLATNDFDRSAAEIAEIYKGRWQIELFFKWLKQNLRVKKFLGRSKNAVLLQIYAAILSYLLLWMYQVRHGLKQQPLYLILAGLKYTIMDRIETSTHRERYQKRRRREEEIRLLQPELTLV